MTEVDDMPPDPMYEEKARELDDAAIGRHPSQDFDTDLPWATLTGPDGSPTPVVQGGTFDDEPTAIEPSRVLVLDEDEQNVIIDALLSAQDRRIALTTADRIANGDAYDSEIDEIARITLRKRRLEGEIKRINQRIADLTDPCVEWLAAHNARNIRHDATGALVARDDTVRLAHRDADWGTEEKAIAKDAAGEVLAADPSTEAFVQAGWNHRRVESYFRDLYKRRVEAMLELPESERTPVDPDDVIPEALRPFYRLNVAPRIKVNS